MAMAMETWSKSSVIRGHHIYKAIWTPYMYVGECLQVGCEENNNHDDHAVAIRKARGIVVGHAPREMSRTFWYFLRHGGEIECKITGHRKWGNRLEVPCTYHCSGEKKLVNTLLSKPKANSCPYM